MADDPKITRLLECGDDRFAFGDIKDAISDYSEAIRLNPKHAEAYGRRAVAKEEVNDVAGALADYDKAIELDPTDADNYYLRGLLKADAEGFTEALADFDQAIERVSDDESYYSHRSLIRQRTGDFDGAISDCDRIFELRPARTWIIPLALVSRGIAKALKGDVKSALEDLDNAVNRTRGDEHTRFERGKVRLLSNDLDGALEDLAAVVASSSYSPLPHVILALIKLRKGEPDDAFFDLDQARLRSKRSVPVKNLVRKLMKLLEQGEADAAIREIGAHAKLLSLYG